jgi:four helix bundle protein
LVDWEDGWDMGKGFEDLEVYKEARVLRRRVWKLTELLPPDQRFILRPQMRRASLSVTNCIAEGHGSRSYKHNISYLYRSRGSVCELQDDFNACEDEGYFKTEHLDDIRKQAVAVVRLLNGYAAYLNSRLAEGDKT